MSQHPESFCDCLHDRREVVIGGRWLNEEGSSPCHSPTHRGEKLEKSLTHRYFQRKLELASCQCDLSRGSVCSRAAPALWEGSRWAGAGLPHVTSTRHRCTQLDRLLQYLPALVCCKANVESMQLPTTVTRISSMWT